MGYYVSATNKTNWYIIAALLFSWLGDVLLIFQEKSSLFFMGGLSSFLLAHIFYTVYFYKLIIANNQKKKLKYIIPVLAYLSFVLPIVWSGLEGLVVPVIIYMIAIGTMVCFALFTKEIRGSKYFISGAILFSVSDSILAINKFYSPFALADILIMATYIAAQYLIAKGAISNEQLSKSN